MSPCIFLLWLLSIPLLIHAAPQQPSGNYLLNCGSSEDAEEGSLKYVPDDNFISTGNATTINRKDVLERLQTLRYFPNSKASKYCYSFPVAQNKKYLVRTVYFYGGFDGGNEPPVFDQIIDGTKWSVVNTTEDYAGGGSSYYEAVVVAKSLNLSVCLARNQHTADDSSPFISSLEVFRVNDSLYNSTNLENSIMVTVARGVFGREGDIISYPDDNFNRYWQPFKDNNPIVESQSNITPSTFWNIPPTKAFASGVTTSRGKNLTLNWPTFSLPYGLYYIALYFQDNRNPSPYSWRVFDVYLNGRKFYQWLNATDNGQSVVGTGYPLEGKTQISMVPTNHTPVGPLINAAEILQILASGGRTSARDVVAMEGLRKEIGNPHEDWVGDPCLPKEYSWTGVSCSRGDPYTIQSLNLTGFGLSGSIPKNIFKLTGLKQLMLGDNKLSGPIPDLRALKSLQVLHLENNQFEGSIPSSLGELPNLHEIRLQNNLLRNKIPDSLAKKGHMSIQLS